MSQNKSYEFMFLNDNQKLIAKHLGAVILGVDFDKMSLQYLIEVDKYLSSLEDFLQDQIESLFSYINSRIFSLFFVFKLTKFTDMNYNDQLKYILKWKRHPIKLFRSGYITLQSIVGWGYYVLDHAKEEIGHKGSTIGREHLTPTLLEGKQPWSEEERP